MEDASEEAVVDVSDDITADEVVEVAEDEGELRASQKARREAQALRQRLRDAEAELATFREAQMSETERAVAEARRSTEESMRAEIIQSRLREVAAGKLANPADAVVFADVTNVDLDDEQTLNAEVERILSERPYLGVAQSSPASIDQGPRANPAPKPTFQDYMRQQLNR